MEQDIYKNGIGMIDIIDIIIGERLRENPTDIDTLVYSIDTLGQLEPILVDDAGNGKFNLIAGGQRIIAFKKMDRTKIQARLFDTLDEEEKVMIELEMDIRRTNLTWAEQAKAIAKLVEIKQKKHLASMPPRFGGGTRILQKDIAQELNLKESVLSENLRVAKGLEEHPALEFEAPSRKVALKLIRDGTYSTVLDRGLKHQAILESFIIATPQELLKQLENKVVDFMLLDPDKPDKSFLSSCYDKLRPGGNLVIFTEITDIHTWQSYGEILDLYILPPSIWHIKGDDLYRPFMWMGKNRERPLRLFPPHISCSRSKDIMHLKAKPYKLVQQIIKSCTEVGAFVLIPECNDIESLKVCIDANRNVRAACSDKILRDKLILNMN